MYRSNTTLNRRHLALGASGLASLAVMGKALAAQETASPESTPGGPSEGFPVMNHQGTCAEYNQEPAFELGEAVTFGVSTEDQDQEPTTIGAEGGVTTTLYGVSSNVDMGLEDIGNEGHVIVVHGGDGAPVACGQISGVVNDGELAMALVPVEGATVAGVALLSEDDGGTKVRVFIFDMAVDDMSATPAS